MVAVDLSFKIVMGAAVPFRSTKEALHWVRSNGLVGRMDEAETGGKGVVTISAESIRETLNPRQREKSDSDKAYAYRVNEIEVVSGTLGGKIALATNPTDTTSICADILLQGALDVNGVPLLRSYTDVTVIILIGQEKIHLKRCVEKLAPLKPRQIVLVESQPDDGGVAIAKETAAKLGLRLETVYHKWPGNQAAQFNWALDELGVGGRCRGTEEVSGGEVGWILRLDADEYLTEQTCEKLKQALCGAAGVRALPDDVAGLTLELKRRFMGGEIRHATNGIRQVRIFRRGKARYADTLMDERLIVDGKVIDFDGAFYDDNLNGLEWWKNKHRGYAKREAEQAIARTFQDPRKVAYYKLPRYLRAVIYFGIRYFLKGGFLDGKAGWMWNFWQGLWYRWIVDREIGRRLKVERLNG